MRAANIWHKTPIDESLQGPMNYALLYVWYDLYLTNTYQTLPVCQKQF